MARLQIWVSSRLMRHLRGFAERQHGDSTQAALGKVVEAALRWWLGKGGAQVAIHWEFKSPIGKENGNGIRDWLFRRR